MSIGAHISHGLCSVSSTIFGFFYLMILFILALIHNSFSKSTPYDPSVQLSKDEKRLVFDLAYYVRLQGFDLETHDIVTSDGFKLQANRLIAPGQSTEEKPRYPLLLIPGLMQSSSAFCTAGPDAIGLVLSRAGYDVWLGNNRGGFEPGHVEYNKASTKMWDWSMPDLATRDVPAMVEYVKSKTGASKIAIGAHSQGTTQTFMALAREEHGGIPDLGTSVSSFSALAPAVYSGPLIDRWFLRMLRVKFGGFHVMMGYRSFMGIMVRARAHLPLKFFTFAAYIVFNYMLGWDDKLWDRHYRDRNFIFAPVYVSAMLMFWWLGESGFADRKCIFKREDTKWYDSRCPPIELYACGRDNLVLPELLINRIINFEPDLREKFKVNNIQSYSHLDVLWALDAASTVAAPLTQFAWQHVEDKERWRPVSLDAGASTPT